MIFKLLETMLSYYIMDFGRLKKENLISCTAKRVVKQWVEYGVHYHYELFGLKSWHQDGQSELERVTYYKHNQTRAATISNSKRQKNSGRFDGDK